MSRETWTTYTGPSHWYQLKFPAGWSAVEREHVVLLRPPAGNASLQVGVFWHQTPTSLTAQKFARFLRTLFPSRRKVQNLPVPLSEHIIFSARGESPLNRSTVWWKQFFHLGAWQKWKLWLVGHGQILVSAVYTADPDSDPEDETLAGAIVSSISISDAPCDPAEQFADQVLQRCRHRFPHRDCSLGDNLQLYVGSSTVNLNNFYRAYVDAPGQKDEIIVSILTTLMEIPRWSRDRANLTLDDVRSRIMPMLMPEEAEQAENRSIGTPWVAGLMVVYVVDEENAYWFIRPELLGNWKLTVAELHDIALANLDQYFERQPMEVSVLEGDIGPQLLLPVKPDAYNSARLLSLKFQENLRGVLGNAFAVGVPNRDFFVAVSLGSNEVLTQIRTRVSTDFQQMHHPLTKRLLLVTPDGVSELLEDESVE